MNRKKREKPYYDSKYSRHVPYSFPKRSRPLPSSPPPTTTSTTTDDNTPTSVLVIGLPTNCSILDLKSRFEVYGSISRTRIDPDQGGGVVIGSVTFRYKSSAEAAVSASLDPSFGITVDSKRVEVILTSGATNRVGGGEGVSHLSSSPSPSSKLLRGETPLSRHGRVKRLSSGIVVTSPSAAPVDESRSNNGGSVVDSAANLTTRKVVAYDDIL